jgi:Fe-S-cluster-containing hydrogenase component 2
MERVFCARNCASRFCVSSCPSNALREEDNRVLVNSNKCYRCGLCRDLCIMLASNNRRNFDAAPNIPSAKEVTSKATKEAVKA